MKIAKKDLALIMVIVGILVAFCSYKFVFSSKLEAVDKEKAKQRDIQTQIDAVKVKAGKEPQMKSDIQAWVKELDQMVEKFKPGAQFEDGILYMKRVETDLGTEIRSYQVAESNIVASVAGAGENFKDKTYTKGSTNYSFSYVVENYEALKTFITYLVSGNDGVKTLDTMTYAVNPDGTISGNVAVSVYVMSDGSTSYTPPVIDGVTTGNITNIFGASGVPAE